MSRPLPPRPGLGESRSRLAEILRVDHAGELGAVHIYRGQQAVLSRAKGHADAVSLLSEMEQHEQVHLSRFDALLTHHKVRPTVMAPLWRIAGFGLGVATALLGEKAAHACTEAVETVIEDHYAGQIAEIEDREPELAAELRQFREEELAHRDTAIANGAQQAPGHALLSAVVRAGCKAAIKLSEKV